MPYKETHEIELPPVTLPVGVDLRSSQVSTADGLRTVVFITVTVHDSKANAIQTLKDGFAALQAAAAGDLA